METQDEPVEPTRESCYVVLEGGEVVNQCVAWGLTKAIELLQPTEQQRIALVVDIPR